MYQGQYPVISISLKSMKRASYQEAYFEYVKLLSDEFERHETILQSDAVSEEDKLEFQKSREELQSQKSIIPQLNCCQNACRKYTKRTSSFSLMNTMYH